MRTLIVLLPFACLSTAQAQYPPQYPWRYPQYGGPYAQPAPRSPPRSLAAAMLEAHNAIRSRVGVPPLAWSEQLAALAQDWARHLIATHAFAHRPGNRFGENIYSMSGGAASPAQVVDAWGAEMRGYDIRRNSCTGTCGHYTQIVWRTTRLIGCGIATDTERQVWVCNYDPPGNVVGDRPY
jgi:pathogenesis-related protein 1